MKNSLTLCILLTSLYYLELFALVDVITFGLSALFIFATVVILLVACLIREGEILDEGAYNLFNGITKSKKSKYVKIIDLVFVKPLIIVTLVYINAPVTLGSVLAFYICGTLVLKHFKSFEWTEDRLCVRKLEKEEK